MKSKEDSAWMENDFEDAQKYTDDEWGPIGYMLNEMKSTPFTNTKRKYNDMESSKIRFN